MAGSPGRQAAPHAVGQSPRRCNVGGAVAHVAAWIRSEAHRCPPDRQEAARFLDALDPWAEAFSFRTFSDTPYTRLPGRDPLEAELRGSLSECWPDLAKRNRAGAAVCVRVNAGHRRGSASTSGFQIRALFADLDSSWPAEVFDRLPPHLVVRSSTGHHHAYWLMEPLPLDRFSAAQATLSRLLNADSRALTIGQALRLPGFWHRKDPRNPWQVRLVEQRSAPAYAFLDLATLGINP